MSPSLARTARLLILPLSMTVSSGAAQETCAPVSTHGLRPFGVGSEIRFEPSAVVRIPGECAVLVFSDKSEQLEAFRFDLTGGAPGVGERVVPARTRGVVQLEGATRAGDRDGVLVVTSGTYKGATFIDQSREDRALVMAPDGSGGWEVAEDLSPQWTRFLDGLRRQVGGWLKVEGLATLGDRYLVGIRQFGDAYDRFDYGLRIAVFDPAQPTVRTIMADPRSVTFEEEGDLTGGDRTYMRTYGVSSLECTGEDGAQDRLDCYMLVTSEQGPGVNDVKTRLLAFDLADLSGATTLPGTQVACFWGKAEGLTLLGGGLALAVFDSDRDRKGGAGGTDLFPLEDNQDYYWIGPVEASMPPPGTDGEEAACIGP